MDEAGGLLGHVYTLAGTVVEGRRRGREIGFPTANLQTPNELIPPHGVYAATLTVDGVIHAAVTNIGMNPTFGDLDTPSIETHVLEYDGDLYGRDVQLGFVLRLRDERRFEDVDALKAQIEADRRRATRLFTRMSV
jgi:riboflavin kinase/FMN adenylyltransferase